MSRLIFLMVVLSIITISKSHDVDHTKSVIPDLTSPSMMRSISKTSQTISSKLVQLALDHFLPINAFTLTITNNMVKRRLIDPKIYIDNGHTVSPPPFLIPAATEAYGGARQIALLENDPAGALCYGSEAIKPRPQELDAVSCVLFDKKDGFYAVYSQFEPITTAGMKVLYEKFKSPTDTLIVPVKNTQGSFSFKDYKQFQMLGQMSSGKENMQLHFEVTDAVSTAQMLLQKRVVTSIAGGLVLGGLQSLGTFVFNRITAEVGTTLVLENGSTEDAPFILVDPRWEGNGVDLHDIVPWRIAPQETAEMTLIGPFGSKKNLRRSAIALSFKIQGTNERIVFTIWWPRKISVLPSDLNSYSVSWLTIPKSEENTEATLQGFLKNFVKQADENPEKFPSPVIKVDKFQQYWIWQFPIPNPTNGKIEKFLNVLTNMGDGRKNGMTVKLYATVPKSPNPSHSIPPPKVYTGLPNEIPPI